MHPHPFQSRKGSALISAAMGAAILMITAAGLLSYLSQEYTMNFRSRSWNQALHLAEAGVEIGFNELNYRYYFGGTGAAFQPSSGWVNVSNDTYTSTITNLTDSTGRTIGSIMIKVEGVAGISPWVTCVATVPPTPRGLSISRAVRATLYAPSMFPVGLMAANNLNLNGNSITTDSYNSLTNSLYLGNPGYSTNTIYRYPNGDIAANGSITNTLSVGNADVYGDVYTGPGGTFTIGSNGSVGDTFDPTARASSSTGGESLGYVQHDFNVDFPDATLPNNVAWYDLGNINGSQTLGSGNYTASEIKLSGSGKTIAVTGNAVVYVTGDVSITGNGSGVVINPGAHLTVYVTGNVTIAGNGVVNNSGYPINNEWFGLSSSTSWSISGNGYWDGAIYAPEATVSYKGGGSVGDSSGAIVAYNIVLTGNVAFHYDEALGANSTGAGYAFRTWLELRNVNGNWVP